MTAGSLIREARERLGWTQTQLAERVGVTPSFITKVEKDDSSPGPDVLLSLANLLQLDFQKLLALVHEFKQKRVESRQRVRTRGAFRLGHEGEPALPEGRGGPAEQLGREILDNPDLKMAYQYLRTVLEDPTLKPVILKTLETFAEKAKRGRGR
jgi:transcriptional regulator with XRE-family HTH domain